ncbi:MAG: sulfurtransferase TusA family protein [Cyanobacteriota bacterium]|nr:sulfurtransferase TusA family protein [Cyanobacteriota bacterium]
MSLEPTWVELDLRGTPCPLNFIRTKLALEAVPAGGHLRVSLDRGEPEQMVAGGLRTAGHGVQTLDHPEDPACVVLVIEPHA